jgi:AcrR family transcriptional regulator
VGRKRLHDEDLKQRLLDVAGERLHRDGVDGLSLRALASDAGTSTAAVYSLFGGKPGLLAALHERAFRRFGQGQAAVGVSDDALDDILRLGRAYRASAEADPHGYRVMFGGVVLPDQVGPDLARAAADTFMPLLDAVRRGLESGRFVAGVSAEQIATAMWANVHGLVSLELGGFLPPHAGDLAGVFEAAIRANLHGWTAAPAR